MDLSTTTHHKRHQLPYHPTNNNSNDNHATKETDPDLSPLEQEVLDEYAKLAGNLDNVPLAPTLALPLSPALPFSSPITHAFPLSLH